MSFLIASLLALQDPTIESMKADIEAMRPAKHAWRDVAWKVCPLEALRESREKKRPVLVWVFLGNPNDERC